MSRVISIADQRLEKLMGRFLEQLDYDYNAMLRRHAADGLLGSGNTIKKTMDLLVNISEALRDSVVEQSEWVISQSVYVPLSIFDDMSDISTKYFDALLEKAEDYVGKATKIAGQPNLFERVYPDLESSIERSFNETIIEIEALVISNRSSGIKGVAKYLFSIVSKLWGG